MHEGGWGSCGCESNVENCYLYNDDGDPVTEDAKRLEDVFRKGVADRHLPVNVSGSHSILTYFLFILPKKQSSAPSPAASSKGVAPSGMPSSASSVPISLQTISDDQFQRCAAVIQELKKPEYKHMSWPFEKPVDPVKTGSTDYSDVIKHRMDMSTFERKLYGHQYGHEGEFEADVRLMFRSCYTYNP